MASPIRDDEGRIVAGLSIAALVDRHDPCWSAQLGEATVAISRALGYRQARAK